MLDTTLPQDEDRVVDEVKQAAMEHLERAFDEAEADGLPPDAIAHAALFAALAELVACFGEDSVARLVAELPDRIASGDYTLARTMQ